MSLGNSDFGFYSSADAEAEAVPGSDIDLSADIDPQNTAYFPVSQCLEGGWETDVSDGRTMETDTTVSYNVVLEFEDADTQQAFLARDDVAEIVNTMDATVQSMTQDTLQLEIARDYEPGAYADGVVPDDPTQSLSDNTMIDLNDYDMKEFTSIMQETYPDIGLVGATVADDGARQSPGCYGGIDQDIASMPAALDVDQQADVSQANNFTGMKI